MSEKKEIMVTIGLKDIQGTVAITTQQDAKEVMEKIERAVSEGGHCLIEGQDGQELLISGPSVGFARVEPVIHPMMGYMRTS